MLGDGIAAMKTILVIEDEAQAHDIFYRCLTFEGFRALRAETGSLGVELAKTHRPDLIICDIMMPDLDGYQVLSHLHQEPATAGIPFIFLTAKVTMTDLRRGMELGADDYLTKPCTVEQFLSAITTRLKRHEALTQVSSSHAHLPSSSQGLSSLAVQDPHTIFPHCPKLTQVFRFIEAQYRQPISLNDIAQAVGYSPAYLTNLMQLQTGRSVKRWVTERRMAQARLLLETTVQSVQQIAEAVGYNDVSYFIRQFRQLHDTSPQAWRSNISSSTAAMMLGNAGYHNHRNCRKQQLGSKATSKVANQT